jgi:hypothetical protein
MVRRSHDRLVHPTGLAGLLIVAAAGFGGAILLLATAWRPRHE